MSFDQGENMRDEMGHREPSFENNLAGKGRLYRSSPHLARMTTAFFCRKASLLTTGPAPDSRTTETEASRSTAAQNHVHASEQPLVPCSADFEDASLYLQPLTNPGCPNPRSRARSRPQVSSFVSSCLRASHSCPGFVLKGWVPHEVTKTRRTEDMPAMHRTLEEGRALSRPGSLSAFQRQQIRQFIDLVFCCSNAPE